MLTCQDPCPRFRTVKIWETCSFGIGGSCSLTAPRGVNVFAQYILPNGTLALTNSFTISNNVGRVIIYNISGNVFLNYSSEFTGSLLLYVDNSVQQHINFNVTKGTDPYKSGNLLSSEELPVIAPGTSAWLQMPLTTFYIGVTPNPVVISRGDEIQIDTSQNLVYDPSKNTEAQVTASSYGGYEILVK